MSQEISLYERLGGVNAIALVVDDFVERILADPVLQANPKIVDGYKNMTIPGLKYLITEQVSAAAGGPQTYTGRTMKDSHAHLGINEEEWRAFATAFVATLDKYSIPVAEQDALLAIVGSTKAEIVQAAA